MNNFAVNVRKAKLTALIFERQLFVIQAKLVKDGRVDVMNVNRALDGLVSQLIRRTIAHTTPDTAPGEDH